MRNDRRIKIDFIKQVSSCDAYGEPIDEWITEKNGVWASKKPILGKEYFAGLTTDTKVEVKFNTRYIPGITNDMRIIHGTVVYEILSAIDVDTLHRELLCYCRAVN